MSGFSKIATHLWFKGNALEAVDRYVELVPNSRLIDSLTFHNSGPDGKSSYTSLTFELTGQRYMALDGSPFEFNAATSIFLSCETQSEIDRLWEGLLAGGGWPQQCGWLTDPYGLCWQIAPRILGEMIHDPGERGQRAMKVMLGMVKLDIAQLQAAYDGK
jgi:predicted 3-demethylubiquinone-9 3-methyltransferase (glyoxalase superfamily)